MRTTLLFILFLFCSFAGMAKGDKNELKANYYYTHYAYNEAIPFFEQLTENNANPILLEQLGDCYRLTGNHEKAAAAYEKATAADSCSQQAYLNYGLVLMRLARYEDAVIQLKKYSDKHGSDKRLQHLISSCDIAAERMRSEFPSGVTAFAPFNSEGSDFAPTLWKGNLVFVSDSNLGIRKGTDKWSGNHYYGIYSIANNGHGNYGNTISKIGGPKELNIKYHTGPCTFTADGKEMYFTRSKYRSAFMAQKAVPGADSSVYLEIMIARDYDTVQQEFRSITPFGYNSNSYSVAHPAISPDGSLIAFTSDMQGCRGGRDLYMCSRTGSQNWSKPMPADSNINTEGDEVFPWWADDSTLYFSSDGHEGLGGLDIYRTIYNKQNNSWSVPENMPQPLNSPGDDISLALPANGGSGYFSSDRPAGKGGDNIYYYRRMKLYVQVHVTDSATHKPITAHLTNNSVKKSSEQDVVAGIPFTEQLWPNTEYFISVRKDGYKPASLSLYATSNGTGETDTIVQNIALARIDKSWDSTFAVTITETTDHSRPGIMDSPMIGKFEVNKVYVIGFFDFNFSKFYYKSNKVDVNVEKRVVLDTLTNILRRNPTMVIQIRAHTDCRGTDEYNMKLSIDRAASVVTYLLKKGIAKNRLEYKGFGETMPQVPCPDCQACTEDEHAQNRVLEFKVLKI